MNIEILKIQASGLNDCLQVIHRSFAPVAGQFHLTEQNCPTHTAFIKLERLIFESENGVDMYGVFEGEEMVGFVGLDKREREIDIKHLCVLPEKQNLNYGTKLMAFACEKAAQMGYRRVTAGIIDANERLKRFYERLGFREECKRSFPHLPFTVCYLIKERE